MQRHVSLLSLALTRPERKKKIASILSIYMRLMKVQWIHGWEGGR